MMRGRRGRRFHANTGRESEREKGTKLHRASITCEICVPRARGDIPCGALPTGCPPKNKITPLGRGPPWPCATRRQHAANFLILCVGTRTRRALPRATWAVPGCCWRRATTREQAGGTKPLAPVRCRWGLCSVILRGVEARRRQPKKWRRRNILSRGLSLSLSP